MGACESTRGWCWVHRFPSVIVCQHLPFGLSSVQYCTNSMFRTRGHGGGAAANGLDTACQRSVSRCCRWTILFRHVTLSLSSFLLSRD